MSDEMVTIDKVLVTGAAGGVGRHVVRALLDEGKQVVAVDRGRFDEALLYGLFDEDEVEWRDEDLLEADLDALVRGCDAIVHAAAWVSLSEQREEIAPTNVGLVERLHAAGAVAGVAHFVHFSCGTVYQGSAGHRVEHDETSPYNAYEQSKLDAERALRRSGREAWTILRPSLIYGPHCQTMASGVVTLPPILKGLMPYLPGLSGGPRTNWCHVADAARAATCVLGRREAFSAVFNVADDTPLGFGEVMTSITEAYGLPVGPLVPFPSSRLWSLLSPVVDHDGVFFGLRRLLRRLWRRVQRAHGLASPLRPRVDRNALFYVEQDSILDAGALKGLGWRCRYPDFRVGIVETVRWYQEVGWAPRFDAATSVQRRDRRRRVGFGFRERLEGRWRPVGGHWAPASLAVDLRFDQGERGFARLCGFLDGELELAGHPGRFTVQGTVVVSLLAGGRVVFEMGVEDPEGRARRVELGRPITLGDVLDVSKTIEGRVVGERAELLGDIELRFAPRDELLATLKTARLILPARQQGWGQGARS